MATNRLTGFTGCAFYAASTQDAVRSMIGFMTKKSPQTAMKFVEFVDELEMMANGFTFIAVKEGELEYDQLSDEAKKRYDTVKRHQENSPDSDDD